MQSIRILGLVLLAGLAAFFFSISLTSTAHAEEGTGDGVRYVELSPTFIANYGYSEDGRLAYVRTDISLTVHNQEAENAVLYHFPALRNVMVLALSRQDEHGVSTTDGRDALKLEALDEVRALLEEETGEAHVADLLFTNFIVQR